MARKMARKAFGATLPELVTMQRLAQAAARFAERIFAPGTSLSITAGVPLATNLYELNGRVEHVETED
jgi:hypothetical protein